MEAILKGFLRELCRQVHITFRTAIPVAMIVSLHAMTKGRVGRLLMGGQKRCINSDSARVSLFMITIIEQLPNHLGKVLRVQSDQLRTKRRLRAEEQAMEAPIKMMLPLVGCIFPVILVVLLGPAILQAMKTFSG